MGNWYLIIVLSKGIKPRPWHDTQVIALLSAQTKEKESWASDEKAALR